MRYSLALTTSAAFIATYCNAAPTASSDSIPPDFPGTETPYRVIPTRSDAPAETGTAGATNSLGTYLYSYNECNKNFGAGAKGKIDDAYYDAWTMTKRLRQPGWDCHNVRPPC
jgi:hypothetical protein